MNMQVLGKLLAAMAAACILILIWRTLPTTNSDLISQGLLLLSALPVIWLMASPFLFTRRTLMSSHSADTKEVTACYAVIIYMYFLLLLFSLHSRSLAIAAQYQPHYAPPSPTWPAETPTPPPASTTTR
ncbi:MAG: hypothetical protein J0L61_00715 [Planctomycetes bacterium]|nr:hypothetical protein [Planctomycetota bacterium]